jgi:hypothetical protein
MIANGEAKELLDNYEDQKTMFRRVKEEQEMEFDNDINKTRRFKRKKKT